MTIKSLLIGSAAAIVAASGAQAADAIVAADPEPVEYVQVCDTFGSGYFYIPGESTCLHIGGFVRAEATYSSTSGISGGTTGLSSSMELYVDAKTSTEIGTVASHIRFNGSQTTSTTANANVAALAVDRLHITIGDGNTLNVGFNASIFDTSIAGEQAFNAGGGAGNQVTFTAAAGDATFMVQALAAQAGAYVGGEVAARVDFSAGDFGVKAMVGYDGTVASGNRVAGKIMASYMGFGAYYQYTAGTGNNFGGAARNVYGIGWSGSVSDSLAVSAALDYADGLAGVLANDAWNLGLTADYTITEGLVASARVMYRDNNAASGLADTTALRFRLTRSF